MNSGMQKLTAGAIVLLSVGTIHPARANLLTVSDASDLVQSTASDVDVFLLGAMTGFQFGSVNYTSTGSTTGWTGLTSGTYGPSSVSLSYTGNLTAYPNVVTWSSTGAVGANSWAGTGTATITDVTATTFNVAFSDSVTLGGNSASIDYNIPGTVLANGDQTFGTAANGEAGTGTLFVNGTAVAANILPTLLWYKPNRWVPAILSDINYKPIPPFILVDNIENVTNPPPPPPPNGVFALDQTIFTTTVPEPSTWAMMLLGFAGLAFAARRRKKLRPGLNRGSA
jgi:hypothetical protein